MKILVTGAAGYIGSVVTEVLCNEGVQVLAIDSLVNGHRAAVDRRAEFLTIDLLNSEAVAGLLANNPVDAVVHLAAEALVDVSIADPGRFYRANLTGGINLLEGMAKAGVKKMVFSSTAAVYGQPSRIPIPEEDAGSPCNTYGETKWAFERALAWYERAYGIRHISLRYFNACGATEFHGEDHRPETHILPILFEVALGLRPSFSLFGTDYETIDGTCIRDYVHVVDIAHAHLCALHALERCASEAFNIGLGHGYTNRQAIETVERVTGKRIPVVEKGRRSGDPAQLVASSDRIRKIGWAPQFASLEKMVESAWRWRSNNPHGYRN